MNPDNKNNSFIKHHIADSRRWLKEESFSTTWNDRNRKMLALYLRYHADIGETSFTEYGCGPNRPFTVALEEMGFTNSVRYDIKTWEHKNFKLDLNKDLSSVKFTNVGVFSGVLEYLNNIYYTLDIISRYHDYIILSYNIISVEEIKSESEYVSNLNIRCSTHGWRNHLDIKQLVGLMTTVGYLQAIEKYGEQIIALIKTTTRRA